MRCGPRARRALAFSAVDPKPFVLTDRRLTLSLCGLALLFGMLQAVALTFELSSLAHGDLAVRDGSRTGSDRS